MQVAKINHFFDPKPIIRQQKYREAYLSMVVVTTLQVRMKIDWNFIRTCGTNTQYGLAVFAEFEEKCCFDERQSVFLKFFLF